MEGVGIAPLRSVVFGLVVVLLSLIAPTARAQVKDVAPSQVVVTRDKAEMRCGSDRNIYYKSGEVAAGTVLTIDGEMGEWARVSYPPKATAFVATNSVRYDEAAGTATLIEASRLYAENAVAGHPGSWKTLLANPLPAGTVLKVTALAKDEQGRVIAYHVVPP
ncbi:MAG: hypothetical protein L6Q35_07890, partial [Phycisphaerales bacterium]|nr:hypothetical protein [Phycisphaerales bacterium]